jgi:predicted nucleic acid-binding protein
MSAPFVADCSIGVGWIHPSQATDLTRELLDRAKEGVAIHVPALWTLEVASALLVAVRRKIMTEPQRQTGLALLSQLKVVVDHETSRLAFTSISEIAANHSLSVYDAAYIELSRRKSLPLATRDEPMKAAAKKCGAKLC